MGESGCGKSTTGRALLRLVETREAPYLRRQRIDTLAGGRVRLRQVDHRPGAAEAGRDQGGTIPSTSA
ncbi:hypothetical protein CJ430_31755, partial [Klebsiella pneumoniae]